MIAGLKTNIRRTSFSLRSRSLKSQRLRMGTTENLMIRFTHYAAILNQYATHHWVWMHHAPASVCDHPRPLQKNLIGAIKLD